MTNVKINMVMLNVVMRSVVILSGVMLGAVVLNVAAPTWKANANICIPYCHHINHHCSSVLLVQKKAVAQIITKFEQ
jgi:hypothetical protein